MKYWPLLVTLVMAWAFIGMSDELSSVVNGLSNIIDYIKGSWPPDLSVIPSLREPMTETFQMGLLGVGLGSVIAIPLSILAASDTTPNLLFYAWSRVAINICRSIPTLLWAILFVAVLGLGPMSGIIALAAHCIGSLGKYFSEGIEATYPKVKDTLEAMEVDGANRLQTVVHGVAPAVAPLFASYIIYYLEWAIREGAILGLVGAGGLGLRLTMSIRMFKRHETAAIVLVLLIIVTVIDFFSRLVRKQILEANV